VRLNAVASQPLLLVLTRTRAAYQYPLRPPAETGLPDVAIFRY